MTVVRAVFTFRPHFHVCGGRSRVFTVAGPLTSPHPISRKRFMKQSAAKTLGVAALGAAFAVAGAGAANAAPAVPDTASALDTATRAVPTEKLSGATAAQRPASGEPAGGLLGGLPLEKLPTQGLNLNGLPLG
ncbi:predicted protein [Streptomyces viridosporus ATCC 14672]|uniref:Predicted protein n=2 Tax=Streptomyces viridosporus TaxID=67581 RepID=D6A1U1_STRV1|nr:predicted protein [Streptomyces viridosporus ATCC 14672]